MNRTCEFCGEEFIGRSDKRFCSDQCRASYNNHQNRDARNYIRSVNNTLRKNRRILEKLNPNGKSKVHKNQLIAEGFSFKFYTNIYKTKSGNVYYFCYEQGYLVLDNGYIALVVRENY